LAWQWDQVDWKQGFVTLRADETKSGHGRAVPILKGDMLRWLERAREQSNGSSYVFNRIGDPILDFRKARPAPRGNRQMADQCAPAQLCQLPSGQVSGRPSARPSNGHTTTAMLFAHYREVVTPEAAEAYWKIMPANSIVNN